MILPKFESHHLDLHIWSYKIHKLSLKSANLNYPTTTLSLTRGTCLSAGPTCHRHQNRGGARDGVAAVKLADGDFTGDEEGTSVTTSTSRID